VKSSLRDVSPNSHALRDLERKQSLPWPTRCRAKQNPKVLPPWHAPLAFSSPSRCIRRRPCPPEITERTVHDPSNRQGTLAPSSPGKLRFCAILVASCGSLLHTVVFYERCRVAPASWFHRSVPAVSRRAACAEPRGLTLPSKGRPQASFACLRPPLTSNVRPANTAGARFGIVCRRVMHRPSLGFVRHLQPAPSMQGWSASRRIHFSRRIPQIVLRSTSSKHEQNLPSGAR